MILPLLRVIRQNDGRQNDIFLANFNCASGGRCWGLRGQLIWPGAKFCWKWASQQLGPFSRRDRRRWRRAGGNELECCGSARPSRLQNSLPERGELAGVLTIAVVEILDAFHYQELF